MARSLATADMVNVEYRDDNLEKEEKFQRS